MSFREWEKGLKEFQEAHEEIKAFIEKHELTSSYGLAIAIDELKGRVSNLEKRLSELEKKMEKTRPSPDELYCKLLADKELNRIKKWQARGFYE